MDFLQLDVAQQHRVRDAIVREWRRRQGGRYLLHPGRWHACRAGACRMVQLACDVRLVGQDADVAIVAPGAGHVSVRCVFVCWETGKVHTCTDACSRTAAGACRRARCQCGAAAGARRHVGAAPATVHRRGRRGRRGRRAARHPGTITEYLCSETRRRYALRLLEAARGKTRRWVLRRVRERHPVQYADVLEYYGNAVWPARACTRPLRMAPAARERLVGRVADTVHRLHVALGADAVAVLSSTRVFCLAAVYLMRSGLRCSRTGQMAVPRVAVLGFILPNAHLLSSNTFPDIHETQNRSRQLTNSIRYLGSSILKQAGTTQRVQQSCWGGGDDDDVAGRVG